MSEPAEKLIGGGGCGVSCVTNWVCRGFVCSGLAASTQSNSAESSASDLRTLFRFMRLEIGWLGFYGPVDCSWADFGSTIASVAADVGDFLRSNSLAAVTT
jgi:hypothetical protein